MLRKDRDITPRIMRFINWWKERCLEMLEASPFRRSKMVKEVEILDDESQDTRRYMEKWPLLCSG